MQFVARDRYLLLPIEIQVLVLRKTETYAATGLAIGKSTERARQLYLKAIRKMSRLLAIDFDFFKEYVKTHDIEHHFKRELAWRNHGQLLKQLG